MPPCQTLSTAHRPLAGPGPAPCPTCPTCHSTPDGSAGTSHDVLSLQYQGSRAAGHTPSQVRFGTCTVAGVAFAGVLVAIMRSGEIRQMLVDLVQNALGSAG
ncbi:MAG: DUF4244 domain-containing protein [Actinobacteria bacterium]|nr:DUF4244 domain-containing protein [Actinomycetota bacterium]